MAVVIDEMEVVPAQPPEPSEPVARTAPDLPAPTLAEQLARLLEQRAARAQRLRAD
jgi:hypothetical protein